MEFMGPLQARCHGCVPAPTTPKLCFRSNGSQALMLFPSSSDGMSAKSSEVGGRELGRREKVWGQKSG